MFSPVAEAYATALGFPAVPMPPDGLAVGPIGYSASFTASQSAGTVLDIPQATGTARLGAVLDKFSTAAAPDVVARFQRATLRVSSSDTLTPAILRALNSSLYLSFSPSNGREIRVPLFASISTYDSANAVSTTDTATTIREYAAGEDTWIPLSFPEIDLSQDNLNLVANSTISAAGGQVVTLDLWFDGILVRKSEWKGQRDECVNNAKGVQNLALQRQSPKYLSKMV